MVTSYTTAGQGPFSGAETFGDDYYEEAKSEIVMDYLAGASPVEHPRRSDRMYRLLEIARIALHDFGLSRDATYNVMVEFNQSRVYPPVDDGSLEYVVNAAVDHWTDKHPAWRLCTDDSTHLLGEYDITSHSYILPINNPSITAKAFLRFRCSAQCMPRVRLFQGKYWVWDGSRYVKIERAEIQRRLEEFLEMSFACSDKGFEPFPTKPKVLGAIMESVQRIILLPDDIQLPYYLGAGDPPGAPETLIFGHTKTLRLSDRAVFDSQPYWFSTSTLALDPDPDAPEPVEWIKFLDSVFEDDQLSKDLLHECMGLIVAGDISFQKILLMVGPTRSGKSTTLGVMEKLVGRGNFCAITVRQLSERFGLANLLGKKLIEMNEVYFDNTAATKKAVEKLLSMSGGDTIPTEQKYKDTISTRIDGPIVMSTNRLPDLANVGSALSARLLPLVFTKSFLGSEDVNLGAKFEMELPGILNLALDGLERLRERGRFVLPPASEEMLARMQRRFDPLAEFIKERCNRQGRCPVQQFLEAYNRWRAEQDMEPVIASVLGRELANYPSIKIHQGTGGGRFYAGVELK